MRFKNLHVMKDGRFVVTMKEGKRSWLRPWKLTFRDVRFVESSPASTVWYNITDEKSADSGMERWLTDKAWFARNGPKIEEES